MPNIVHDKQTNAMIDVEEFQYFCLTCSLMEVQKQCMDATLSGAMRSMALRDGPLSVFGLKGDQAAIQHTKEFPAHFVVQRAVVIGQE